MRRPSAPACALAIASAAGLACSSSSSATGPAGWTRQLGTPEWDAVQALAVDPDGNLLLAGSTGGALFGASSGSEDAFVVKLDPSGRTLWGRQLGAAPETYFLAVATDPAGHVFAAGATQGTLAAPAAGEHDLLVARLDPDSGATVWVTQAGSASLDILGGIAADAAGRLFVAGWTSGSVWGAGLGDTDMVVARLDPDSGATVWTRHLGTARDDNGDSLAIGAAGHVLVVGSTSGAVAGGSRGGYDGFLVALDPDHGTPAWARQFGTSADDLCGLVRVDRAGDIVVACSSYGDLAGTNLGERDVVVMKLDPAGLTTRWTHRFASADDEVAWGLATDAAGNVLVAGMIFPPATATTPEDIYLLKLSSGGELLWTRRLGAPGSDMSALAVDGAGNAYLGGDTAAGLDGNVCAGAADGFVVKYAPDGTRL